MFRILTQKTVGKKRARRAQSAVEYLLLLGLAVVIALVGFKEFLPKAGRYSEIYYNRAANAIYDDPPICGLVDAGRIIP